MGSPPRSGQPSPPIHVSSVRVQGYHRSRPIGPIAWARLPTILAGNRSFLHPIAGCATGFTRPRRPFSEPGFSALSGVPYPPILWHLSMWLRVSKYRRIRGRTQRIPLYMSALLATSDEAARRRLRYHLARPLGMGTLASDRERPVIWTALAIVSASIERHTRDQDAALGPKRTQSIATCEHLPSSVTEVNRLGQRSSRLSYRSSPAMLCKVAVSLIRMWCCTTSSAPTLRRKLNALVTATRWAPIMVPSSS